MEGSSPADTDDEPGQGVDGGLGRGGGKEGVDGGRTGCTTADTQHMTRRDGLLLSSGEGSSPADTKDEPGQGADGGLRRGGGEEGVDEGRTGRTTAETTTMDDGAVGHRRRPTVAADEHLRARRYTAAF